MAGNRMDRYGIAGWHWWSALSFHATNQTVSNTFSATFGSTKNHNRQLHDKFMAWPNGCVCFFNLPKWPEHALHTYPFRLGMHTVQSLVRQPIVVSDSSNSEWNEYSARVWVLLSFLFFSLETHSKRAHFTLTSSSSRWWIPRRILFVVILFIVGGAFHNWIYYCIRSECNWVVQQRHSCRYYDQKVSFRISFLPSTIPFSCIFDVFVVAFLIIRMHVCT